MTNQNNLLTAQEVAEILRVAVTRVYDMTRRHLLPPGQVVITLGRQKRYSARGLSSWLANGGSQLPGGWRRDA